MKRKSEKGATTLFVLIAGLSFIAFLTTVLAISAVRRQSQLEATKQSKEIYSKGDANTIYENFFASDGAVPIYTFEQFKKICTGEQVAINEENGKYYTFSNDAVYVLMNDLIGENTGIYPMPNTFANTGRLEKNGKSIKIKDLSKPEEVYYYYNSSNDYAFPLTKEGYSYNGLMLCYDGTNNTGDGHSNTATTWKDLSGNGNDGTLNGGPEWTDNALILDGVNDWVAVTQMNYANITLEAIVKYASHSTTSYNSIIGNVQNGGYELFNHNNGVATRENGFTVRVGNTYYSAISNDNIIDNRVYSFSGSYDGAVIKYFENGIKYEREIAGNIGTTANNTIMAIGTNPNGNSAPSGFFNGNIYSVRVYNRALTDAEVNHNNKIDNMRVNMKIASNAPILPKGNMDVKYVTWTESSGTFNEVLSSTEPANWYDYDQGKWANIKTSSTTAGSNNQAYWVWIPRYAYKVPERPTTETYTQNPTFEIAFLDGVSNRAIDESITGGATIKNVYPDGGENSYVEVGDWVVHPAFNWGGTPLSGIWVAKFEASSNNPIAENGGGDITTLKVNVLPAISTGANANSVVSWRGLTINTSYTVCKNMSIANSGEALEGATMTDPHLMKNIEWGAVVYLTQSKYGQMRKNTNNQYVTEQQVWNNPNNSYKTGQAGNSADDGNNSATSDYNTGNGPKASTTGNVYGIYDMAGGTTERTAAYVANTNAVASNENMGTLVSSYNVTGLKYVDVYPIGNPESKETNYNALYDSTNSRILKWGDAIYETSCNYTGCWSWQSDFSYFPGATSLCFRRGGEYFGSKNITDAGVFYYTYHGGSTLSDNTFRPVFVTQ